MGGVCLAGLEVEAVEFEEENANHKPRPLVAPGKRNDKRMVADDTGCVKGGQFDDVRGAGIGMVLAGTRQSGFQKAPVTQSGDAAVKRQESIVDRERIALFDPEWFFTHRFEAFTLPERAACFDNEP